MFKLVQFSHNIGIEICVLKFSNREIYPIMWGWVCSRNCVAVVYSFKFMGLNFGANMNRL